MLYRRAPAARVRDGGSAGSLRAPSLGLQARASVPHRFPTSPPLIPHRFPTSHPSVTHQWPRRSVIAARITRPSGLSARTRSSRVVALDAVPAGAAGEGDGLVTVHWLTHHREVRQQAIQDTHNRLCPALETARLSHRRIGVSRS